METTPVSGSVLRPSRLATSSFDIGSIFSVFFRRLLFWCCFEILLCRPDSDDGVARKALVVDMEDVKDNSKKVAAEGIFIVEYNM